MSDSPQLEPTPEPVPIDPAPPGPGGPASSTVVPPASSESASELIAGEPSAGDAPLRRAEIASADGPPPSEAARPNASPLPLTLDEAIARLEKASDKLISVSMAALASSMQLAQTTDRLMKYTQRMSAVIERYEAAVGIARNRKPKEPKPGEPRKGEPKPPDARLDAKPADAKPLETRPTEQRPSDAHPDGKPAAARPIAKPAPTKSAPHSHEPAPHPAAPAPQSASPAPPSPAVPSPAPPSPGPVTQVGSPHHPAPAAPAPSAHMASRAPLHRPRLRREWKLPDWSWPASGVWLPTVGVAGAVLLAVLIAQVWSGHPPGMLVEGLVTFDGQPVAEGRVTFEAPTGRSAADSAPIVNGRFTLYTKNTGRRLVRIVAVRQVSDRVETTPTGEKRPVKELYLPPRFNTQSTIHAVIDAENPTQLKFPLQSDPDAKAIPLPDPRT